MRAVSYLYFDSQQCVAVVLTIVSKTNSLRGTFQQKAFVVSVGGILEGLRINSRRMRGIVELLPWKQKSSAVDRNKTRKVGTRR